MPPKRLTVRQIEALKPGSTARDPSLPGFFAEGLSDGRASFKVQAELRTSDGRKLVKRTLGRFPDVTLDDARTRATALLAEVRAGKDPRTKAPAPATSWTVGRAFEAYIKNLAKRPGSELSQRDMQARLTRYLEDWRDVPLASLTREMCEARQAQIAAGIKAAKRQRGATGARTANATIRDLSSVWSFASDYTPLPPANPCRKITLIGEVRAHHEIPMNELPAWWAAVGELKSPLRRAMHRLGLLSGLRPGNLTAIERAWLRLDANRIDFPAAEMKSRRPFTLPLSAPMVALVREALAAADMLEPKGKRWLFPSRNADGEVTHMFTVREKPAALKDCTGHALRHTYKTCARNARLAESQIAILMAHRLGGMADTYGSLADQFDRLLEDQTTVSAYILGRVRAVAPEPTE